MLRCLIIGIFSAMVISSCVKDDPAGEIISLSVSRIEADMELGSYPVDVTANCSWSASARGAGSADASWVALSKTEGNGNGKVTVRVLENKYKDSRMAVVDFVTPGGKKVSLEVIQEGNSDSDINMTVAEIRLGTYNIRMANLDEGDNAWPVRKVRLYESIRSIGFDIFGLQEVNMESQEDLRNEFGDEYTCWFFSPYSQSGVGNKAQGIMFRTSEFSVSDKHFFWTSDDPDTMTKNDTGSEGDYCRGGHCAVITHKVSGVKFFFMNTHGCLNDGPNERFAYIYEEIERKYNPDNLPSFFVGDMNAKPASPATSTYKQHWSDAFETALHRSGPANTFNGYKSQSGTSRIDWIYHRGNGIVIDEYCCDNTLYGGKYPSDHFPVYIDVEISK